MLHATMVLRVHRLFACLICMLALATLAAASAVATPQEPSRTGSEQSTGRTKLVNAECSPGTVEKAILKFHQESVQFRVGRCLCADTAEGAKKLLDAEVTSYEKVGSTGIMPFYETELKPLPGKPEEKKTIYCFSEEAIRQAAIVTDGR